MAQSSAGKDGARRRACSVLTPSRARGSIGVSSGTGVLALWRCSRVCTDGRDGA